MSISLISYLSALPVSSPISQILSSAHNDTLICTFDTVCTQDQNQGKVSSGVLQNAIKKKLSMKKVSEASQEKDEGAGLVALAGMHRTIKQQTELIRTMYEEIKGLREL